MKLCVIFLAFFTALVHQGGGSAHSSRSYHLAPVYQIRPESTLVHLQRYPLTASFQHHSVPAPSTKQACTCVEYRYCSGRSSPGPYHLCQLSSGFTGVCCDLIGVQRANLTATKRSFYGAYGSPNVYYPTKKTTTTTTTTYITVDLEEVKKVVDGWRYIEADLAANHIVLHPDTKEFSHARFFGGSDLSLNEANGAGRALVGFTSYSKHHQLTVADIRESAFDLRNTPFANTCAPEPTCDSASPYRSSDGTCNNLRRAGQGRAVGIFGRLLPAEYADGIAEPKRATDGGELPNARLVSLTISPDGDLPSDKYTLLLMQFGQFVDHDLTRTAVARTSTGTSISCCDSKVLTASTRFQHPNCFSISVPDQDTFLKAEQQTCIDFVRSAPAVNPKCRFGPREQLNQLSAIIDGNNIYGTSKENEQKLRAFAGGRMKTSTINGEDFLPTNANDTGCQLPKNSERKCFMAGDGRVNEVLDLSVIHNVFLREHNRIAGDLLRLNPQWNDELTYQETKRIVIAEMQHIIYNEFLPLLLGPKAYNHFELGLVNDFTDTYNPNVDPTILNEFATAAYRLHSLVAGTLNIRNSRNRLVGKVALRDQFNNPGILYERGGFEMRIDGLTGQTIQKFDNFFSRELTNHLFQIPGKRFGLDLVALNIQRGRDHGIPGYVKYRDLCGLSPVKSFADLKRIFSNYQVPDVMSQLYRSVDDIDLFIGGTSEKAMPGAVVGPTFACIIGEQFKRIKEGDRFWYENGGQTGSFTPRQLAEIKKSSMARVFCDNSAIGEMQPNAFLVAGQYNPKLNCEGYDIPRVSLKPWANYR